MKKIIGQNLKNAHRLSPSNFYDFKRKMDPKNIDQWVDKTKFQGSNVILEISRKMKKLPKPKKEATENIKQKNSTEDKIKQLEDNSSKLNEKKTSEIKVKAVKEVHDTKKTSIYVKPIPYVPKLGPFEIENPQLEGKTYHWCSCGLSSKQPFCDRSHKGTSFKPINFNLAQKVDKFYLCGCKLSTSAPFCDNITCCKLKAEDQRVTSEKINVLDNDTKH